MLLSISFAASICLPVVLGNFLTGTYAPPVDLTSNASLVRQTFKNISDTFDVRLLRNDSNGAAPIAGIQNITFSLAMFSLKDCNAPSLQYHHTAPEIQNSQNGTKKVDADSIYRAASITKLITVLTGLLELNQTVWDTPVAKLVPRFNTTRPGSPRWDQITPRHLASHQAGLQRIGPLFDYFALAVAGAPVSNMSVEQAASLIGVPMMNASDYGGCFSQACKREQFIDSTNWPPAAFLPATNPSYSNFGLMVLGLVISEITGKPYDEMFRDALFGKLDMTSSFANAPTTGPDFDRAVVSGPFEESYSFPDNNPTLPSGGILTTINDLNKLGLAILNSTLMTPLETREWMKPLSHTSSLSYSMGAPWEIIRYVHPTTGKVTDIYSKSGDSGNYGGILALIPDYQAGFSFLNAANATTRADTALAILDELTTHILPALEAQAAAEARKNYVGTYTDPTTNSSLEISFNHSDTLYPKDGLSMTKWQSRGVDMIQGTYAPLGGLKPRLLPAILEDERRPVFQATTNSQYPTYAAAEQGPFTGFLGANGTDFDVFVYEGYRWFGGSFASFEFVVDEGGKAVSVRNQATRAVLRRVE